MTISRSDWSGIEPLEVHFVDSSNPDTVGVEFSIENELVFDLQIDPTGQIAASFGNHVGYTLDLGRLRSLLDMAEVELRQWRHALLQKGGAWEDE